MGPRFEKIMCTQESLQELEKLLLKKLPESVHLLALCRIAMQNRFSKKIIVQFYKYVDPAKSIDDNDKDPFVVCLEKPNLHTKKGIILLTPQDPTKEMVEIFDNFIGWEDDQTFQSVQQPFWEHLQNLCMKHKNATHDNSLGIPGVILAISKNQALAINPPTNTDSFSIRPLDQSDVACISENWKWGVDHTEMQIRETIKTLVSCGLFVKSSNEEGSSDNNEQLASYVMLSPLGTFNALHTVDEFRRQGFARKVMEWATKQAAVELQIDPLAEVEVWNTSSKTLLEKVGYREVYQTRWYYYEPPCTCPEGTH